jgi:hypothetical protein
VTDAAHEQLRAAGALMEEALDEDEDNDVDAGVGGGMVLDEKAVLPDAPASIAVDLPLGSKRERLEDASVDAVGAVGSWVSGRSSVTYTDDRD